MFSQVPLTTTRIGNQQGKSSRQSCESTKQRFWGIKGGLQGHPLFQSSLDPNLEASVPLANAGQPS